VSGADNHSPMAMTAGGVDAECWMDFSRTGNVATVMGGTDGGHYGQGGRREEQQEVCRESRE